MIPHWQDYTSTELPIVDHMILGGKLKGPHLLQRPLDSVLDTESGCLSPWNGTKSCTMSRAAVIDRCVDHMILIIANRNDLES